MQAVIDSDVLVDYLQGLSEASVELMRYEQRCISLISWMEVMAGVSNDPAEETACRRFLGSFRVLPVTLAVAERAVSLRRVHRLKLPDAIIWASAQGQAICWSRATRKTFRPMMPACAFLTGHDLKRPADWQGNSEERRCQ